MAWYETVYDPYLAFEKAYEHSIVQPDKTFMVYDHSSKGIMALFKAGGTLSFGAGYEWMKITHPERI